MQKIFEPIIIITYLAIILYMGSYLIRNSVGNGYYKTFGSLALTLALGDGIYLIPRMYSVLTTGIENNLKIIGWGRMGNAIIITILFLILYDAYNIRYSKKKNPALDRVFYGLALIRILLSILPWNKWFEITPSSTYVIIRMIPLSIMGVLLVLIMYIHSNKHNDINFKLVSIATLFAIVFMEPLLFFPSTPSGVTIFTILRTIAFIMIVFVGYKELRDINVLSRY